ncbi:hypothetical protein ACPF8X_43250, partial [Streptomyces sp. G35A]
MSWYCQQIGGNETSVGHDDGYVGIEGSDGIVTLAGLHAAITSLDADVAVEGSDGIVTLAGLHAGRLNGGDTEFLGSLGDR